jgi:hypothetical protein
MHGQVTEYKYCNCIDSFIPMEDSLTLFKRICNKTLSETGIFKNGVPNGNFKVYGNDNAVMKTIDYKEGVLEVNKANKWLNRYGIHKYMDLLARNWTQVKYSDEIIAIGTIVRKGEKNSKGYYNKGKYDMVDGGTGYAVTMGINHQKEVYVFDQPKDKWFLWSYSSLCYV